MAANELTKSMMKVLGLVVGALAVMCVPIYGLANGGDQRVVDGTYLINLARAPFTPRVGEKISFLASFVDIRTGKLVADDLSVDIRIAKLGGGAGKREFVFEQDGVTVNGGVLEFSYTFDEAGLQEIFFDFAFAANPQTVYEAPDFLLDVQRPRATERSAQPAVFSAAAGILVGFLLGWFIKRPKLT